MYAVVEGIRLADVAPPAVARQGAAAMRAVTVREHLTPPHPTNPQVSPRWGTPSDPSLRVPVERTPRTPQEKVSRGSKKGPITIFKLIIIHKGASNKRCCYVQKICTIRKTERGRPYMPRARARRGQGRGAGRALKSFLNFVGQITDFVPR